MEPAELEQHIRNKSLDAAVVQLEREQSDALSCGEHESAARAANDLGVIYAMLGRTADGRRVLTEAQHLFLKAADPAGQGRACGNLAQIEEKAGNTELASVLYAGGRPLA